MLKKSHSILVAHRDWDALLFLEDGFVELGYSIQGVPTSEKLFDRLELAPPKVIIMSSDFAWLNGERAARYFMEAITKHSSWGRCHIFILAEEVPFWLPKLSHVHHIHESSTLDEIICILKEFSFF
jgi:hypothetical protein